MVLHADWAGSDTQVQCLSAGKGVLDGERVSCTTIKKVKGNLKQHSSHVCGHTDMLTGKINRGLEVRNALKRIRTHGWVRFR